MAKPENNNNIIEFRKPSSHVLGYLVIFALIIYISVNLMLYLSAQNVTAYEVSKGVIATNNTFKGMIIRDETVVYAPYSGYINYYVKSGTKISATDIVYSIDTDGAVAERINSAKESSVSLDSAERNSLLDTIDGFSGSYEGNDFYKVYSFKEDFGSDLSQSLSNNARSDLSDTILKASEKNTFFLESAGTDGVIAYYVDGMESATTSNFFDYSLTSAGYSRNALQQNTRISQGNPVCKVVNSESWNIVIAISTGLAEQLNTISTLNVTFTKDDFTTIASTSITKNSGQYYLILTLKSGMIRYLGDRYEEVKLVLGNNNGLKIPKSALTQKEFFKVPAECFNGNNAYLLVRDSANSNSTHQVEPAIFYNDGENYYIDDTSVKEGDVIQYSDSTNTYIIGRDMEVLDGVFNINKGYAVFRHVNILSQNTDYAIVEAGLSRSISLYDRIALDASKVTENKILKR